MKPQILNAITELEQYNEELLQLLKKVEWVWQVRHKAHQCPICRGWDHKHKPTCKLDKALRKYELPKV